jgi:hypothetical protein
LRLTLAWLHGAAIGFAALTVPAHADPVVSWAPSAATVTLVPNSATSLTYRLTATEDIVSARMRVTPSLTKYLTVTPASVANVRRGQWIDVTVTLTLPIDAAPDPILGTIQLRLVDTSGKVASTLSRPLPVTINVQCPCLPPDPGLAGGLTLEGVDANANGVRDDLERAIAFRTKSNPNLRASLNQFGAALQKTYGASSTLSDARLVAEAIFSAIDCVSAQTGEEESGVWVSFVQLEFLNSRERVRAYTAFEARLAGEVFSAVVPRPGIEACALQAVLQ